MFDHFDKPDETDNLLDKTFNFYGVDGNYFKLDNQIYEAIEDRDDGYRSYLTTIVKSNPDGLIFFNLPLAKVRVESYVDYFHGYILRDTKDDHIWLRIGTDHTDEYYPFFVFHYRPKKD